MKDMDKKIRNNFFIALGANLVLLAVFFSLFYFVKEIGNSKLESSVAALRKIENMQSNFSIYDRAVKETAEERSILDKFVVNIKTVSSLIAKVEELASRADVSATKTVSVEKQTTMAKENMLRFGVRASGDVTDIFYFMTLLENMPYKFRFKSLAIGAGGENTKADLLAVSSSKNGSNRKGSTWVGEATFEILSYINE